MANEIQFKLVLLGNMSVGKTSMALRFVRNQFFEYQENTIGGKWMRTYRRCWLLVVSQRTVMHLHTIDVWARQPRS